MESQSSTLSKSALLKLVEEYGVKRQVIGVEYSTRELSDKLGLGMRATQRIMDEQCKDGTWDKRRVLLANGHIGTVYFEAKK